MRYDKRGHGIALHNEGSAGRPEDGGFCVELWQPTLSTLCLSFFNPNLLGEPLLRISGQNFLDKSGKIAQNFDLEVIHMLSFGTKGGYR